MRIYVVRHGAAIDRSDPKCPSEAERYLIAEGMTKTKQVARALAALGIFADVMIASPYVRAWQTAEIFAGVLGYSRQKIQKTDLLLPSADVGLLFRELSRDRKSEEVFLFGHGPQVDGIVAAALGAKKNCTELKKSGVAVLEMMRVSPPNGRLLWMAPPRLLRRVSGKA
ncbi:MAG TPA: histidine phosphatase family protein [Candidatus Dormibacteraeota bacterium]|nr:histidine phosphatase family protein [Candidatus Dormibacteraeota bacterium]